MSLALYRKYRPKSFDDLIGQPVIAEILRGAAAQDRIGHAYLLSGPRGTGKTTAARLIAKVANCETRNTDRQFKLSGEPCNNCRVCLEVNNGQALDVVEIDAASNRGIDEIRNLKENVRVAPTSYQRKVFIIDEAHMLTKEAFNALLKVLEEPPQGVVMVLATTEIEKIPPTIASRTQRFYFKKASLRDIVAKLSAIASAERIRIKQDALELIASAAEGSFRDSEALLEQLFHFNNTQEIAVEQVEQILGKTSSAKIAAFAEKLLQGNLEESLHALNELQESGHNLAQFCKDIIHYLRKVLVLKIDPKFESIFGAQLASSEVHNLKTHTALFKEEKHIKMLKNLIAAYGQIRYSHFPIIPLEVAVVESLK